MEGNIIKISLILGQVIGFLAIDPNSLCTQILQVDCNLYAPVENDEVVCGTNQIEYPNFCVFSRARCLDHNIDILRMGGCSQSSVSSSKPISISTSGHSSHPQTTSSSAAMSNNSSDIHAMQQEIASLKLLVGQLTSTVNQMKAQAGSHTNTTKMYSFYAYSTHTQYLGAQKTIMFDYAETNIGNCFNTLTGKFRAPVRGLYFFSGNIMAEPGHFLHIEIVKNGRRVSSIFAGKSAGAYDNNTGNAVINLLLQAGDEVWIRDENDQNGVAVVSRSYAMFSGFLITQNV